jgi:hypothetical protein
MTTVEWTKEEEQQSPLKLEPVIIDGADIFNCIFCGFRTCIEPDIRQHLRDQHWMELVKLPIGQGSMKDVRIPFAVNKGRENSNKPIQTETKPNFDSLDLELAMAKSRWISGGCKNLNEKESPPSPSPSLGALDIGGGKSRGVMQ